MSRDSESESDPCSMPPSKTSNRCWKNEHYPRASWRHKLLLLKISSRNFVSKRDWELEPASKWKWDIELTSLLFARKKRNNGFYQENKTQYCANPTKLPIHLSQRSPLLCCLSGKLAKVFQGKLKKCPKPHQSPPLHTCTYYLFASAKLLLYQ